MTTQTQPSRNLLQQSGFMHIARGILQHVLISCQRSTGLVLVASLLSLCCVVLDAHAAPSPGATCVVTAQNRTAPMEADGGYALYNLPGYGTYAFAGAVGVQPFRVRAVCDDGTLGETPIAFPNLGDSVVLAGDIVWGKNTPKPSQLQLLYPTNKLRSGQTLRPTVIGYFEDGSTQNLTQRVSGTGYRSSSPYYVGVMDNGDALIQFYPGSAVVISAENDGVVASRVLSLTFDIQLAGTVYKHGGTQPVAGAKVSLPDLAMEATTDANGQYYFDDVPMYLATRLIAYEPLTRSYLQTVFYANPNTKVLKNLELAGVGSAVVSIVDANDTPLQGIDVAIADSAANVASDKVTLAPMQVLKTDAQGMVTLQDVAAGTVSPVLAIKGYTSTPATATLSADGTVNFTVKVTGNPLGGTASLTGTISENGTGLPGVGVVIRLTETTGLLRSFSFLTGANGKYLFEGLQPTTNYQVDLLRNDIVIAQSSAATGSAGASRIWNFGFERGSKISGVVRNSDGVTLAPNTTVNLSYSDFVATWKLAKSVVTDAQGRYEFSPLAPWLYRIDAIDQGGKVSSAELRISSAGSSVVQDIILPATLPITTIARLDVRDQDLPSNLSLGNTQIYVTNSSCATPCLLGTTVAGVSFVTNQLPLGLNVFEARRGGISAQASVNVDASTDGQIIQKTLLLAVTAHDTMGTLSFVSQRSLYNFPGVAGEIVDLSVLGSVVSATPAAYAVKIEIYDPSKLLIASGYGFGPPYSSSSFYGAIKSLTLGTSGTYSVVVSPYYNNPQYLGGYWLELAVNGEVRQLLPFAGGGSVEGTVFKKGGVTPVANQTVDLLTQDAIGLHERTFTDAQGHYRFDNVPLTDLTVSAVTAEYIQTSASDKLDTPAQVLVKDLTIPAANISGVITYQGGMPAQYFYLSLRTKDGQQYGYLIRTDSQGGVVFNDVPAGVYDIFIVDPQGIYPPPVVTIVAQDVIVTGDTAQQFNWTLPYAPALFVKVKRSNGTPAAGVYVEGLYQGPWGWNLSSSIGTTGADGLVAVDPRECQRSIRYVAHYPGDYGQPNTQLVVMTPFPHPCNQSVMEMQFAKPVADLKLVVTNNGNTPMAGAEIIDLMGGGAPMGVGNTDSNGVFIRRGISEGVSSSYLVKSSDGLLSQQIDVVVDAASDGTVITKTVDFATQLEQFGKLSFTGERHLYSVSVKQGDTLAISAHGADVDGLAGIYLVRADIYSPDKVLKASGNGYGSLFNYAQYNVSGDLLNTRIDADGNYVIAIQSYYADYLGGYFLRATVNGQQLIELKPYQDGGAVQGSVTRNDGATPASSQTIDIRTQDALGLHIRTTTDAAGQYRFGNVPLGDLTVSAIDSEQVLASASDNLNAPAQVLVKDMTLDKKTTLQVTITVPDSAAIPAAMNFSITDANGKRSAGTVQFGGNNTSSGFSAIAVGDTITVNAIHPMNAQLDVSQVVSGADGQTVAVNLVMASATVSGTIMKADGTPSPGTLVRALRASDLSYVTSTYTDLQGVYLLTALPVGQDLLISVQNPGNYLDTSITINVSSGQELVGQDITLIPTGSVTGLVKYSSGTAIPDISVVISGAVNGSSFSMSAVTDQNGQYRIDSVPVGATVQVSVTGPSPLGVQQQSTTVDSPNQLIALPDFTFVAGATLQVNVLDGNHQANPDLFFSSWYSSGCTNECGYNYIVVTTSAGDTVIEASGGGFAPILGMPEGLAVVKYYGGNNTQNPLGTASINIAPNQTYQLDLVIPLVTGGVRLAGGFPVPYDTQISLTQVNSDASISTFYPAYQYGSFDPGAFVFVGVQPGEFTIDASSASSSTATTKNGIMVADANLNIDVILPFVYSGAGAIVGSVKFSDGSPAVGIDVELFQSQNGQTTWATTDGSGYYLFDTPLVGAFEITAQDPNTGLSSRASGTLVAGVANTVNLVMPPAGSVIGTLYDTNNNLIANADVYVNSSGLPDFDLWVATDAQGRYRVNRVAIGTITAAGFDPNTQLAVSGSGTLSTNLEVITVDLHETASGMVSGRVLMDATGTPMPNANVTLMTNRSFGAFWPLSQYVVADASGVFSFGTAPPGGFRLFASDPANPAVIGFNDGTAVMNTTTNVDVTLGNGAGLPFALAGTDGYQYSVGCDGSLQNGVAPYANANYALKINNSFFPCYPGAGVSFDKRELTFGPATMETVQVTRRVFSPTAGGFVRYIDTYLNPGNVDSTINVQVGLYNLTYYSPLLVDPASNNQTYAVLGSPAVADVFGGLGGTPNSASTFRYQSFGYLDYLGVQNNYDTQVTYQWTLTVPAGKSISLMHYSAQAADGLVAQAIAISLSTNAEPSMFDGIAPVDKPAIYNFAVP